jgi:DNA-directed RNA polymerase subunit RPC12/RpoP
MIKTGSIVQQSGIYKCTKCGNEITCVKGERVPPCGKCFNTTFSLVRATK